MQGVSAITLADLGSPVRRLPSPTKSPTRGVDIGAIEFIHQRLIDMRDRGAAILLVSVELDEVLSLSDRIVVMFDGKIVGEIDNKNVTDRELGLLMAGVV